MNFKSTLLNIFLMLFASNATGQDSAVMPNSFSAPSLEMPKIENPFKIDFVGGDGMMGMDMGMDDMGIGDMGMDDYAMSEDELFRKRMEMAIQRMRNAKTAAEKSQLMTYTEAALRVRYDQMIQKRKTEINRLKESLANLEDDLDRRAKAVDRVVKLQMQSAVLAAEGLLDLNALSPELPPRSRAGADMGMGMGPGN